MPSARHRWRSSSRGCSHAARPLSRRTSTARAPSMSGTGVSGVRPTPPWARTGGNPSGRSSTAARRASRSRSLLAITTITAPPGSRPRATGDDFAGQGRLKCHQFGGSSPRTTCRRRPTSSTTGSRWCGGSPTRSSAPRSGSSGWAMAAVAASTRSRSGGRPVGRAHRAQGGRHPGGHVAVEEAEAGGVAGPEGGHDRVEVAREQPFDQVVEVVDELGVGVDEQRRRPAAGQSHAGAGGGRVGRGAGHHPRGQGRARHPVGVRLPPERGEHLGVVAAPPRGGGLDLRRQPVRVGGQVGAQQVALARRPDPPPEVGDEPGDRPQRRFWSKNDIRCRTC